MSEYLTPEEVQSWVHDLGTFGDQGQYEREAATLRAYAQVVEAVAQCSLIKDDLSVDTIIFARELRGHADQG